MRTRWAVMLVALAAGCSRQGAAGGGPDGGVGGVGGPPEEVAKLEGAWTGSVLLGDAPGGEVTVEFTTDTVTITRKGQTLGHYYAIDPTQNPKWIDFKGSPKSDPPMPSTYGIYELDGDQLQICVGNHGKRPERFGGRMGTVTAIYRLTRK